MSKMVICELIVPVNAYSQGGKLLTGTLRYVDQRSRGGVRTKSGGRYLHQTQRQLDVRLQGDHSEKMYGGFCDDRADQRRKPKRVHIAVRVPDDDDERG